MTYCASTSAIDIDWSTERGATTLQVAPDDPSPRAVASSGRRSIPAHDVTVTLTVASGELAPHRSVPVRAAGRHPMSALVTDAGGGSCVAPWVTSDLTDFGGGPSAFDPRAHPALISNLCDRDAGPSATCRRAVRIAHAGRNWSIAPNGVLDLTHDPVTMEGSWALSQQLLPDEECGTQSAISALEIDLSVEIDCE
jgi:hypothetical protein